MNNHKDLIAWQKAVSLARATYRASQEFPPHEKYGLTAQVRRAGISIGSNIAEGSARASRKEFLHFLHIARGSLAELETQIVIAQSLGFLPTDAALAQDAAEVGRLIGGLISSLRKPRKSDLATPAKR